MPDKKFSEFATATSLANTDILVGLEAGQNVQATIAEVMTAGDAALTGDARFPTADEKAALAGTDGAPDAANAYVTNSDARNTNSRAPSGSAGGSLGGTYPNPSIAAGAVGGTEVAAAIKDPVAATAGLRTLGTGATQAAAGNDSRLTTAILDTDFAGSDVGVMRRTGAAAYAILKDNLTAVVAPAVGDDNTAGYAVGSLWVDTVTNIAYICTDAGTGAAVWQRGNVLGISSSTDQALAVFDGTGGKLLKQGSNPAILDSSTGKLTVAGPVESQLASRSVSTDVTLATSDELVLVDTSGGNRQLTLPAYSTKFKILIKKSTTDANTITLVRPGGAGNIEGTAANYLLPGSSGTARPAWMAMSDGSAAWVA